jgi:hypothetical protein
MDPYPYKFNNISTDDIVTSLIPEETRIGRTDGTDGTRQRASKICSHNSVCGCTTQVSGAESLCATCKAGNC